MNAEQAEAIEPVSNRGPQKPFMAEASRPLRIAEQSERNRVQRLIDLSQTLMKEAETLAGERAFAEEAPKLENLNFVEGFDYFDAVKRFETSLIKLALARTGGHQVQAAKLLNMKPTTLNSKIKLFGIEY